MGTPKKLVSVPTRLRLVTTIAAEQECLPEAVDLKRSSVDAIWARVEGLYRTGLHPAISFVLRRRGRVVLKRAIGHARGNGPGELDAPELLATPDTPICLFSASKAITALLVHKLAELGQLSLDERVATYVPEYGVHGKARTTVRQLLAHRAGIPSIPIKDPDPAILYDWDRTLQLLCAAKPFSPHGLRQAYHAITGGFILGEIVRRVSGRELGEALREWLAEPLGCRYLSYGLPEEARPDAAVNYFTGGRPPLLLRTIAKRVLGAPFERVVEVSNEPGFHSSVIPAGNVYATADEAGRVFQMMLDGGVYQGRRLFKAQTLQEAVRPFGKIQWDGMLVIPIRFSAGMMLGERHFGLFGPKCGAAYGHLGFMNILCWADPERDISAALLTTGKAVPPAAVLSLMRLLGVINRVCAER